MSRRPLLLRFARWHIWLGWAAALPLLVWIVSGLFMAARPIEDVRGEALRKAPVAIAPTGLVAPHLPGAVTRLALIEQAGQPVWAATGADKAQARYSAYDGTPLGPVNEAEARRIAEATFAGSAKLAALHRLSAAQAPLDLRKPRPSWQATYADGTHLYLDADTGEVLALRTRFWRAYDFMWGLHIMDPRTRENTSNLFLWVFGAVALFSCALGSILLFRRRKAAQ